MTSSLSGKTVLITGSSGIAAATAHRLGEAGAALWVAGIDRAEVESLVGELRTKGVKASGEVGDLSEEETVGRVVTACLEGSGRIDGLFNVVGISGRRYGDGPVHEATFDGWRMTFRHNLDPTWLMCREVTRVMLAQSPDETGMRGVILNMASVLATSPEPEYFAAHAYAAAKGAIISLTTAMASCYASRRIRVNALAPGLVRTPMSQRAQASPGILALMEKKQPLCGGLIEADEVARAALFLLSDQSGSITGEVLTVDAGWRIS